MVKAIKAWECVNGCELFTAGIKAKYCPYCGTKCVKPYSFEELIKKSRVNK